MLATAFATGALLPILRFFQGQCARRATHQAFSPCTALCTLKGLDFHGRYSPIPICRVEGEGSWIYNVEVICAIFYSFHLLSRILCQISFHPFTMHFLAVIAFMLPLSALAAPALVERQRQTFPSSFSLTISEPADGSDGSVELSPELINAINQGTLTPVDIAVCMRLAY